MPLMYGEGDNACVRLEDEVSRRHQQRIQLERPLSLADDGPPNNSQGPFYIAVVGTTVSGKSTLISVITGEDVEIGHGPHSCTCIYQFPVLTLVSTGVYD